MPYASAKRKGEYQRAYYATRMRAYNAGKMARGQCVSCGEPAVSKCFCAKHLARVNERGRNLTAKLRDEAVAGYGGKCVCCGEMQPVFLSIDHVLGNGRQHRKSLPAGRPFYRWLIKNNFPPEFQLLCMNCNFGRYRNGGVCPHENG
jgi:hypothetical protein